MATVSGTLRINDAFSNTLNKFNSGVQRSAAASNRLKASLQSSSNGINALNNSVNSTHVGLRQIIAGSAIGNVISSGVRVASSGIRSFIGELNESTVAWSTFEGNMRQIGKSPAQINAAKNSLQKFAQDTIYSSSDMAQTYSQLAAVGVKNTTQLVKGFGGLAAAATDPKQAMKTLSEQATQMAAKPMVQWQDFRLMLEQTPAGMAAVAKNMNMSAQDLVKLVQSRHLKTEDFLNAVAKTGTNANFTKMATQYKTIGQAMDGLRETLANKVQPQFQKLSDIGIKAISGITDKLGKVNFTKFADALISNINKIRKASRDFMRGFSGRFDKSQFSDFIKSISDSVNRLTGGLSSNTSLQTMMTDIGAGFGDFVRSMADGISNLAQAISRINPNTLKLLGAAFVALKMGVNGLKIGAIVGLLKSIGQMNPGQLNRLAQAITAFAVALTLFKTLASVQAGITALANVVLNLASVIMGLINPVGAAILGVTAVIAGGVWAWQNNFIGFKDSMSNLFANIGSVFEPIKSAFNDIGQALAPASGAFSTIGKIIAGISVAEVYVVATGIAHIVDVISSLIRVCTIAAYAVRSLIDMFGTVGSAIKDLFTGNWDFSGARAAAKNQIKDIKGIEEAISHLGDHKAVDSVIKSLGQIDSKAKSTKANLDKVKTPTIAQQNAKVASMDNVIANKKALSNSKANTKVGYTFDTNPAKLDAYKGKAVKTKITPEITSVSDFQKSLQEKAAAKTVKIKYATPKIPTPKTPKVKPLKVKVAKPKVPQPKMPKLKTIPGPKIGKAKTGGFIASVQSAINRAASIAQAGAGPMFSAGAMIGQGLAAGMRSQVGAVAAAANALVAQADRAARAKAKIHSPSRLFAEIGGYIGQGMAIGMDGAQGIIANSSSAMIDAATPDLPGLNYETGNGDTNRRLINSRFGNRNTTSNDDHSSTITIESGAIQINSTGNAYDDSDQIIEALENRLRALNDGSLV